MMEQPDINWYLNKSKEHSVTPRCPYATADRCPRFYQTLSLLGKAGGSTSIQPEEDDRLFEKWSASELWPRSDEQATGIAGPRDEPKHFTNFCPEISFDRFGYFASQLHRYSDECDLDVAHHQLGDKGISQSDWRWYWAHLTPLHYTECPLYSLLRVSNSDGPAVSLSGDSVNAQIVSPALRNNPEKQEGHSYEHDVFICHSSEDKDSFVRPLAEELSNRGLHVWYDEFSLRVGDSLRRSIERGLTNSRHGIVVLSPGFFKKEWPQKELDGLNALEDGEKKIILPIWHRITKRNVLRYSPILADRVAINSSSGIEQVVSELLKVVRPKDKYEKLLEEAILKWVAHGILPSVEELYTLCENINPDQLTRDQMAFLYCAYLSRDDELVDWSENARPAFSFAFLKGYLFNKANYDKSILSSFHINKGDLGMIGSNGATGMFGSSSTKELELNNVVLLEVTVKEKYGVSPAIYFSVQDRDDRGLEVLIIRGHGLKSFVRHVPKMSREDMRQIKFRLIDLQGEE